MGLDKNQQAATPVALDPRDTSGDRESILEGRDNLEWRLATARGKYCESKQTSKYPGEAKRV